MSISLDRILDAADEEIEKRANSKPKYNFDEEDDIFKLAKQLENQSDDSEGLVETPIEKIAHAIAILETAQMLDYISKLGQLEKVALERGISEDKIEEFINSAAPLHKSFSIPECLL